MNLAVYDPLLGKTYAEIGTEARSMHKCQGMAQLLALPGPSASTYQLAESTIPGQMQKDETSLFDGIDSTIPGLAQFAGPRPPQDLVERSGRRSRRPSRTRRRSSTAVPTRRRFSRSSPACTRSARCAASSAA